MIIELKADKGKSILSRLQDMDIPIPAACGGIGRCGRCRIRLVEGFLPVTADDLNVLGREKCDAGWRLACKAFANQDVKLEIKLPGEAQILTDVIPAATTALCENINSDVNSDKESNTNSDVNSDKESNTNSDIYAAVDLGTTTVAILLYNSKGKNVGKSAFINPQTAYGADVISRIQAANEGKGEKLKELITRAVSDEITKCLTAKGMSTEKLKLIVIAGNTTMLHLFRGYSCEGLAKYPFAPEMLKSERLTAKECGMKFEKAEVRLFPGVSAFIGADIVAGVYGTEIYKGLDNKLLMDLGTNGEMVYGNRYNMRAAAAAAGPAFEGGNLSTGMGCTAGAVWSVKLDITGKTPKAICKVIGNTESETNSFAGSTEAEGICGSGAIELLSEAIEAGLVDDEGTLIDDYFESGIQYARDGEGNALCLTQQDIRELQLAKASVRAVAEMLTETEKNEPYEILLAGGMGNGIDLLAVKKIGLLPENEKVKACGNTCLLGLQKYIEKVCDKQEEEAQRDLEYIAQNIEEIPLAGEERFQDLFLENMLF